jgi:hypothetical protein
MQLFDEHALWVEKTCLLADQLALFHAKLVRLGGRFGRIGVVEVPASTQTFACRQEDVFCETAHRKAFLSGSTSINGIRVLSLA